MRRADDFEVVPTGDLAQQLSAALKEITERAQAAGQRHEPRRAARPVIEVLSRRPDGTVTAHPNGTFTVVVHGQDKQLVIKDTREADQVRRLDALANARAEVISLETSCPEDTDETDAARARMGEIYDSYVAAYGPIGSYTVRTQPYHNKSLKAVLDRLDFSRNDVLDPEVKLLEAYLGRGALTRIVKSVTDPGHVRTGTRKDKQGKPAEMTTQLVETARVRAALTDALDRLPEGADAERLRAVFGERISRIMTGEHRTRLMPPAFRADPRRPAVEALEDFDLVTQTATKRPAFFRRTAAPHRMELGADTPQEALDLVLIHHRRVDLGEIARLLGTGKADARKQLGTLVFDDPATGRLVAAGEYLSGNVLEKLATAREAAARDPGRYAVNAESLQAVQPDPLPAEDIQARLGSAWLSHEIVQEGLRHLLKDPRLTVTHPGGSQWTVASPGAAQGGEYGTSDWPAAALARALLTNASITVYRTRIDPKTEEETKYRDDVATLFAFQKAQRLDADFVSWLWSDPQRAEECARLYNNAYNNHVKRTWDSSPFHVPGLAPGIRLHPFQNSMVRRLHTESGLGAWVVGAGKTELGIAAAMEGYRLGRHQLTAIVTPASLVNQWRDRVYRTYPGAKVLVADDDLRDSKDARAVFIERAASGDYQLALTPYEFFGSFPLSAGAARASADEEIAKLTRYARQAAAQGDRYTAKAYQEQVAKIEAQYKAAARATGAGATLVDFISGIVVDEVHKFRRFRRESENRSLAIVPGSARANHMLSVFDYLRTRHPDGLRLGLTGTPLEQSIADAWAMMRLFVPEILAKLGLEEFDAFLTTFGRTEPRREPTPTGGGVHLRERQADWFNLTDMRRTLWDPFADVVRRADLGLKLPKMTGGRPQLHVLPMTPGQAERQAGLDGAYELFKFGNRDPENHILRLMDQGAKNALHPRMLGMETDGEIKLEAWADDAAAWYHASKDAGYLDREGNPHPVPGALRVVACEIGVPDPARPNAWSVYSEMRSLLADRGVPAETVRFAQDAAGSDRKKAALWEDARTGRCNFVIGSAQTAGTGVDIPDRLQVLDYMTLSWNPTEFEQWLGRIIRQGNQNAEVAVHVWATEGTIEAVRADKIAMKAAPFEALLDGTSQTRRLTEEDDNPVSMFATEMTARMTGNPLLNAQREAQLEADVAQGLQNEWQRENIIKGRRATDMEKEIGELEAQNAAIDAALSRAADTRGDKFAARVGTTRHTVRAEAGTALIAALAATAAEDDISMLSGGNPLHLGELAGFDVTARYHRATFTLPAQAGEGLDDGGEPETVERTLITLGLEGVPHGQVPVIDAGDLPGRDPAALVTSLEDRIRRLPGRKEDNTAAITSKREQIAETRDALARPSPYLKQLADARDALDRINEQINELLKDAAPETDAVAPAGAEDAESAPAPPGERTQDAAPAPEPVAGVAAPPAGDAEDLPPWTASSPYSGAIGTALRAALADSDVTQVAGSNRLGGFLEWLSDSGWMSDHAAAAVGDDGQVPPFARAVFDDPVFAADVACAVGTAVHARCAGQPLPPESAARRPIPPMTEMPALRYWQEQDVAIGRAAGTDTWYDLVDAARIDIWLSRAGLPRAGRQVVIGSGGHAALELTAAGGEQWRLTVPARKDTQHEATARYKVTRSGNDAWEALLNGTPGSTTPEQAAALLIGTLTEQGALPPPADAPAPGQASNTPLPPATPAPHSSPQPATAPAPTQPATSTPGGDNDASAPQPDSGPLRDLAAAHGMHYHYDSGTEIAAVFRSETRAGQPVLRQGHPGGPLMNETGRVIPGEHAGAYLAEAARVPHLNSDSLYQQVIPGAVAGEESSPRSAAHAMFSVSAIQARDTGVPQVVYADGHAAVAGPEPPPGGGAYYLATPRGPDVAWTRHMDGTAEPVSHHLQARDLSVIAGETAGHPAPQPPAPEEDSLPQPPTSGLTREELDFARQHAYEFAIGTIRNPDQAQEERALDYAAWYMAEFGDAESLADLPGHDHAWGWFIDRGYPARKPAAPAGGQHDGTQPGTGATAGAAGPPGHADPQPPEPRRQHPDEARPDRAASSAAVPPAEQLDAMTAAALADRAIAGTARQGDTQNFEIAFTDWARHWLAATAVQAIDAARPGPAPPWAVALLDNEELIADMTAAAAGRVLRLAAAGHGAGESPGQPQDDRTPAPDQERDDAAASTSQAGAPAPAVARDLIPPVTVLHGHVSEETAVEVPDYPYGSLRCTMRYWLETRKGHGVRLVHQTTNPKKPGQPRNKPHKDTYSSWAVLYQAANGHVERHACEFWGPSPAADARIRIDGTYGQLDDAERAAYDKHLARAVNANTRGWEDWHAQLASIRGHLAEHGTLPDPGQLAKARGGLRWLHEAEAVAAVAAVAAGLGGIHAAPPTADPPGTSAPSPEPAVPAATQSGPGTDAGPAADKTAQSSGPDSPSGAEEPEPGMTPDELDLVYQAAINWVLSGIASPTQDQQERALDYAAWYMTEIRDGDSIDDLLDHQHAWNWFVDRGYPARAASGQGDREQPRAEAAAGPTGHADPEPPAGPWSAARLRQLAEAHGLAAATDRTGGTLTVIVHDQGRTVLLHDDLNGTVAGGRRLNPGQVAAYVAAYASHPQLPPRCLLDLARNDPAEPASLTLTAARETAARHGLEVRVRRSGGRAYVNFCEPSAFHGFGGSRYTPVLSYPAGAGSAYHGPCAVPVAAIDSYLGAYRASVPTATFAALEPMDCGYRAVPLTPHLIDGSGLFIPAVRDRWRAALTAARDRNAAEVFRLLEEAEGLTPVSLTPEREAELTADIRRHAARYRTAEDPAARLATDERRNLDITWREQGWVSDYIAAHPEVLDHAEEDEPAATPDSDRDAAASLAAQAREALASGEHERALALIDETELLLPGIAATAGYDQARDHVRAAMRQASRAPGQHAAATTTQETADQATGAEEPETAHIPGARDANAAGTTTPASDPAAAEVPPAAPVTGTGTEENAEAPAAAHLEPDTGDSNAEHQQPGSTAAQEKASPTEGQEATAAGHWQPGGAAARAVPGMTVSPPEGTRPLGLHRAWGGNPRPERLLYADGTPLSVRRQGEDGGQVLSATAVGVVDAQADIDDGPDLQVVRFDDGQYGVVHPALVGLAGIDPYGGLSERDRARWQAFDYGESLAGATAGLLPHLVDAGDKFYVQSGQRSQTVSLREVQSAGRGTGPDAGYYEFKIDNGTTLSYPPGDRVAVRIPDNHPTLEMAISATLAAGLGRPGTAPPPEDRAAADSPATVTSAPDSPGHASGLDEHGETGPYSGRVRIALESGRPAVSGTEFDDPPELRKVLRDNFTWDKKRQVWEYNAKKAAGPEEAAQAVRDVLARLDRESAPAPAVKEFPPTPQQQAILDAFLAGLGIAVQALAGTGKTTTLVLLARALMERSPQARIVYTAFNASIVKDAKRGRFGRNVTASTMHSLARQALLQTGYAGKIEHADQGARWPEQWAEVLGIPEGAAAGTRDGAAPADAAEIARLVIATVRKFRESADGEPGRQHLPYLAGPAGSPLSETVLSYARQAWADISDTGNARALAAGRALRVEHDDYLKVWALSQPVINAEVIFFDEAQDVNDVMRAVVLAQPAQTVVVGDSHQSIYGFRGAIDALKDWPADIVLPLTQSWRFGPAAAEFGNLFLRSLGSKLLLEGNPARETRLGSAPEPDAILCRTNATAVAEVFAGLESGKRTALAGGGDAIKEIAKAARDLQAGRGTKHPDLSRFADWGEVKDYARNDEDGKSLQVFVRLVDQHGPGGLIAMIDQLTPEGDNPQLTISTAHKAKGLEWDIVRVAGDFRGPATDPETGEVTWPVPEERRLAYVAATRARKLLEPGSLTWIYDYPLSGNRAARGPASGQDHQAQADTPGQPKDAGREREPAPQAAQATTEDSPADDAPAQQAAPAPATAQAPASDAAASGQVPGASGLDAGQQDPAGGEDTAPAAPGQDSAGAGPGNAHPDLQPSAAEADPGEDRAAPAAEPDGDRSLTAGQPAGTRATGTDDGADPGKQPAAARSDPGTLPAASLDAAGTPPDADAHAVLRALAEQHGMAVTAEQVSPTITVTTVTDGGRFVLRHDDFLGAAADGTRIDLDEAEAYLAAWRAYPGLPALALLDWVRRGPDDPAQLSLSAARAVAADCGLVAEPVRAAGQPFIIVRHPGLSGTVLACRPGDPAASAGRSPSRCRRSARTCACTRQPSSRTGSPRSASGASGPASSPR